VKPRITVLGSFVVGATVRLPRAPLPGETLEADLFDLGPGGKGTNLAIGAARLGCSVDVVAAIGDDEFAAIARRAYRDEGIGVERLITIPGETTGIGLVYVDRTTGENTIGVYAGANAKLTPSIVQPYLVDLERSAVLTAQLEIPIETVRSALVQARAAGVVTLLNPAPARPIADDTLSFVDILTPNMTELFHLVDRPVPTSSDRDSVIDAARELIRRGTQTVVVTLGSTGAMIVTDESKPTFVPAFKTDVIDTVGAGDAFNAGVACAVGYSLPVERAVRVGCACGALATRTIGVINALPNLDELASIIPNPFG
jgi:ribokinase